MRLHFVQVSAPFTLSHLVGLDTVGYLFRSTIIVV